MGVISEWQHMPTFQALRSRALPGLAVSKAERDSHRLVCTDIEGAGDRHAPAAAGTSNVQSHIRPNSPAPISGNTSPRRISDVADLSLRPGQSRMTRAKGRAQASPTPACTEAGTQRAPRMTAAGPEFDQEFGKRFHSLSACGCWARSALPPCPYERPNPKK